MIMKPKKIKKPALASTYKKRVTGGYKSKNRTGTK